MEAATEPCRLAWRIQGLDERYPFFQQIIDVADLRGGLCRRAADKESERETNSITALEAISTQPRGPSSFEQGQSPFVGDQDLQPQSCHGRKDAHAEILSSVLVPRTSRSGRHRHDGG